MKQKLDKGYFPLIVLLIVCVVSTALLSLTNEFTKNARAEQARLSILESKQKIFPNANEFKEIEVPETFQNSVESIEQALSEDGKLIGYLARASSKGYGGPVPVYLGVSREGKIAGVDFPKNQETAGLGQNIRNESFTQQFIGQDKSNRFSTSAGNMTQVDAVAAATISSDAATDAINKCLDAINAISEE